MSTEVSEVRTASIIRAMMEVARTSETSVHIYLTTRQCIPEDSELHTRRRENLKSHKNNLHQNEINYFQGRVMIQASSHRLFIVDAI
jgi:hypothetical protein